MTRWGQLFRSLRSGWLNRPLRREALRRGLDQADRPLLVAAIEHSVGPEHRALAGSAVGPFYVARLVVQAGQQARIAAAVEETVDKIMPPWWFCIFSVKYSSSAENPSAAGSMRINPPPVP